MITKELGSFTNIDISVYAGSIELIKSDRNVVEYCFDKGERVSTCDVMNDTFVFTTTGTLAMNWFNFTPPTIKLYYSDSVNFKYISLKSTSGKIYASSITANKFKISGVSGAIRLMNIKVNEMSIKQISGSLTIDNMDCKNFLSKNSSGRTKLNATNTLALDIRNISGSISIHGTLVGRSVIHTTSGSIKVYSTLNNNEYGYKLSSVSGSTKINDATLKGSFGSEKSNFIDASTMSGSIKIYTSTVT